MYLLVFDELCSKFMQLMRIEQHSFGHFLCEFSQIAHLIKNFMPQTVFGNRLFWGDFGSPFSSKIWERLKSFTILKRNYLRSFLEYFGVLWTHPFFESGAPISLISLKKYEFRMSGRSLQNPDFHLLR